MNREVHNLAALVTLLNGDPAVLTEEILEFLTLEARKEFRAAWAKLAAVAV